MKNPTLAVRLTLIAAVACGAVLATPLAALAQNVAIVNGKAVPKARVDALLQQAQRSGQQLPPNVEGQARDQVVLREIFAQEADRKGISSSPEFRAQMELARQGIVIGLLFADYSKKNPATFIKSFPLIYRVIEPVFATSDERTVEFAGGKLTLTACSGSGGSGSDAFVFYEALDANTNVDFITDFNHGLTRSSWRPDRGRAPSR